MYMDESNIIPEQIPDKTLVIKSFNDVNCLISSDVTKKIISELPPPKGGWRLTGNSNGDYANMVNRD